MKICAFLGSPRKQGNTYQVLDRVLTYARELGHKTEIVYLQDKKISGCTECFACQKVTDSPGCSIKDDMRELYSKLLDADCVLLATPVFCWSFSGQIKMFLDRTYCMEKSNDNGSYVSLLEGKKSGLVVTAAGDEFEGADLVVEAYRRLVEFRRMKNIGHLVAANILTAQDLLNPEVDRAARKFAETI